MSDDVRRPCGRHLLGGIAGPWQLHTMYKHACLTVLGWLFILCVSCKIFKSATALGHTAHSSWRSPGSVYLPCAAVDDISLMPMTRAVSAGGARAFWRLRSAAMKTCFLQVLAKKLQPHCKVVKIDTDKYPNLASRNQVQVPPHLSATYPFISSPDELHSDLLFLLVATR